MLLLGGVLSILLVLFGWILFSPVVTGDEQTRHAVEIQRGLSFDRIMQLLRIEDIIQHDFKPRFVARVLGLRSKLKAGRYELEGGLSSYRLLRKLVAGEVTNITVTIPEGLQSRQIAALLAKEVGLDSASFVALVNDVEFTSQLGVQATSLEGFLFPNTYRLPFGITPQRVIRLLVHEFHRQFNDSLRSRALQGKYSLLELVTLASIIEGEAVIDSERPIISAVYRNRLRRGMRLQADPTIQYIVNDGPRRLLKKDLAIDSPYNTYKYSGLPPGPINNPGLASLMASFNPAKVGYLYFVANGDGSHTFSKTLTEHLRAKAKFDRYRRDVSRAKRGKKR